MLTKYALPFTILLLIIILFAIIKIILYFLAFVLCRGRKSPEIEIEENKKFSGVRDELRLNHIVSYNIRNNPEYAPIIDEIDRKIAKEEVVEIKVSL